MGVTHKLKPEVVGFIVQTKQQSPKIGVRTLAELTGKKFSINISKSSVNNILKESELSSPIGRRRKDAQPGDKNPAQFTIPPETKVAIRENLAKSGHAVSEPQEVYSEDLKEDLAGNQKNVPEAEVEAETEAPVESGSQIEIFPPEADEDLPGAPDDAQPPEQSLGLLPDPVGSSEKTPLNTTEEWDDGSDEKIYQDFALGHAIQMRAQRQYVISSPLKGFGTAFLYAANMDFSSKPFMGDFLKNELPAEDILYLDKLSEQHIYELMWKNYGNMPMEAAADYGYWEFLGFRHPPDNQALRNLLSREKPAPRTIIDYFTQKEQLEIEIGAIKLQLRDGSRIMFDSSMVSWWERQPAAGNSQTLSSAARALSQRIIANVDPWIIGAIAPSLREELFDSLILLCDNEVNKQIMNASLLTVWGDEIAVFSTVPKMKRRLILGIYPWQDEFSKYRELLDGQKQTRVYYEDLSDQLVYFRYVLQEYEYLDGREKILLKVIGLGSKDDKSLKCIILSNITGSSEQEIIQAYLRKWPELDNGEINCSLNEQAKLPILINEEKAFINIDKIESYEKIILNFGEDLHNHVYQKFFHGKGENDISYFFRNIYNLFGAVEFTREHLLIYLMSPKDSGLASRIKQAAAIVNERQIVDEQGRIIHINLIK